MRNVTRTAFAVLVLTGTVLAAAQESQTTEVETIRQPWGTMLTTELATAPFPDDSRTTGFQGRKGFVPYEGHYDDGTVVFLLPSDFKPGKSVDLIFYFHGHSNDARHSIGQMKLADQLAASRRNAILVIPQGPKDAPDSSGGKLEKPEGFKKFVAEVLETLARTNQVPKGTAARNIVLAAHSGGYRVVAHILEFGGLTERIREVWLFDASYGNLEFLAAPFAAKDGERQLRSVFTDHLMPENVTLMSYLSLAGKRFGVFEADELTTVGTQNKVFSNARFHSAGAEPAKEELPSLLKKEPLLFLHTKMAHNEVPWNRSYLRHFAETSPNLQPTGGKRREPPHTEGP